LSIYEATALYAMQKMIHIRYQYPYCQDVVSHFTAAGPVLACPWQPRVMAPLDTDTRAA